MALPKSTFVMGIVTLGLFGVAIYETTGKKGGAADRRHVDDDDELDDDDDDFEDDDDSLEEYRHLQQERERQLAEAEAARTAKLAKRKAALRQLYGAEKASPGALFAGVELDAKDTPDDWVDRRAAWIETSGFRVSIGGSERNDRFRAIPWNPLGEEREELCTALETGLGTSWGSAWVGDDGTLLWTNEITGVRASFQPSDCELRIERFDLPVKWLSKSGASTVPLSWVGKPASLVEQAVGEKQIDGVVEWVAHGLGAGAEQTTLQAFVVKGKISHIVATTSVNPPTRAALEEHLRAELGKPKLDEADARTVRMEWPSRQLVVELGDSGSVVATVGRP